MKNPLVSIIIASYNYAEYISQSIESILGQTYKNWELIIVDDGSKDNSVEIINKYANRHENIYFFQHENAKNMGLKQTLILGIKKSQGEHIAFLESDDFWESNYLEEKILYLNKFPEAKLIYNTVNFFGDEKIIKEKLGFNKSELLSSNEEYSYKSIVVDMLDIPVISTFSSVFIEKNTLEECDFNTPLDAFLDWWLWSQVSCKHKILHINKKLTNLRIHNNSYTDVALDTLNQEKRRKFLFERYKLFLKNINFSKFKLFTAIKLYFYIIFKIITLNIKVEKIFRSLIRSLDVKFKKSLEKQII